MNKNFSGVGHILGKQNNALGANNPILDVNLFFYIFER